MQVLLTGGSGNLGQTLVPKLLDKGDAPVILDVRAPRRLNEGAVFIEGSVLDPLEVDGDISRLPQINAGYCSRTRPTNSLICA